jgi:hypothetical protein
MSLAPSSDGLERLQERMGQKKQNAKVVIWRDPALYRYTAAAACLALVCLFGWLYWPGGKPVENSNVAVNDGGKKRPESTTSSNHESYSKPEQTGKTAPMISPESVDSSIEIEDQHIASTSTGETGKKMNSLQKQQLEKKDQGRSMNGAINEQPMIAQVKTPDHLAKAEPGPKETSTVSPLQEQPVVANTKPAPASERVLVVTIAEPEALVAARQAAKTSVEEKAVVASVDREEKDAKPSLWQQVKRFKQGEVLARGDEGENDRSLIGRAYNGLKHSFDKDKSTKQ